MYLINEGEFMWTRKELKDKAKLVLKKVYWKAFAVSIIILLAGGNGFGGNGGSDHKNGREPDNIYSIFTNDAVMKYAEILMAFMFIFMLIFIAYRIFVGYHLEVGGRRYFLQTAEDVDTDGCFRFAFTGDNYKKILFSMFWRDIMNFLWFLALIIPGIINCYGYRMVPYILAENPTIGRKEALRLSEKMTLGHKFDMFVLDVSFLGWYILGLMALVIGTLFVLPYQNATNAELYLVLRNNLPEEGLANRAII